MTLARLFRIGLILSPALGLAVAGSAFLAHRSESPTSAPGEPAAGRLVVVVVFDQLRGDYLDRWGEAFGPDGFRRVAKDGVWFDNIELPFACSSTGPGHASIATGAVPAVHGIVENAWYERGRAKPVYCASGDEPQRRIPAGSPTRSEGNGLSPVRLLVPTVGDALRKATDGKSRVFSLSLKDRAAVLLGGKDPSGVYCFDTADGEFHTSIYYRDREHAFVEQMNGSSAADRWSGKLWERLLSPERTESWSGPDAVVGEATKPADRIFPHSLAVGTGLYNGYYAAMEKTPFGNELLWECAKAAIVGEQLGLGAATDLLYVSFSSNDLIGHTYGPDSQEVFDVTVRSDRLLGQMIAFLNDRLGADKYALVITADHGVCPLPEVAVKAHPAARRANPGEFVDGLDEALDEAFGKTGTAATRWLEFDFRATHPWLYLNKANIEAAGVPVADVERYLTQWIGNRPGVQGVYAPERFLKDDTLATIRNAYVPNRCGDLYVLTEPYILVDTNYVAYGTTHGTLHPYDRHVPVLAFGSGVPVLGRRKEKLSSLIVAPITCKLLDLAPPATVVEPLPAAWK